MIEKNEIENTFPFRLVLFGIGVSGFCALGYEVLWTRILTLTIGTSVYGFSVMLIAFLTGIALGSEAYRLFMKIPLSKKDDTGKHIIGFGIVQFLIGAAALVVTLSIRDLPLHSIHLKKYFLSSGMSVWTSQQWANLIIAFSYMVVPSFFMGLAFPLAGKVNAVYRKKIGHAVGAVLSYNTAGAILGSAVSGYFMIYFFGLERSLQLLTIINMGFGLLVIFSIRNSKIINLGISGAALAFMIFLILKPGVFRLWDIKFFAIFQNNRPEVYDMPEKVRDAIENTDILYYHEGINSTISSIRAKGGAQSVLVNGKVVASDSMGDLQLQLTLGHLPMLLHENPKRVLVVGLGTGMTLGAASVHPGLEELVLAEIEPKVTGAARTFGKYNHYVLDNPKLKIIFNDARNYLLTTKGKFDVITADPIHPWTQGSGYLYTTEYFKTASERLLPEGIMCQWLSVYELSNEDLKSVVKTFSVHFRYTMAWLTHTDVALIGSNSPLLIDEDELERRIAYPSISKDLKQVMMGSSEDLLGYFLMGAAGIEAFSSGGIINTDDNLYLEFSAPLSMGKNVMGENVGFLSRYRESMLGYLLPAKDVEADEERNTRWTTNMQAVNIYDPAHAMFLGQDYDKPEFRFLLSELVEEYPDFAPGRFLEKEYLREVSREPVLIRQSSFAFLNEKGQKVVKEIAAVKTGISEERAAVIFVDNEAKIIYGQVYFSGSDVDASINIFAADVIADIQNAYRTEADAALARGKDFPSIEPTMDLIINIINKKVLDKESDIKSKDR